MNEYYFRNKVKNPREEINSRYPACLTDRDVLQEVIAISNASLYKMVSDNLTGQYGRKAELMDDIMQQAAVRLCDLLKNDFNNKTFHKDFYGYVCYIYNLVAHEVQRQNHGAWEIEISREAAEKIDDADEKSGLGRDIIDFEQKASVKYEPGSMILEKYEEKEIENMGKILFDVLANLEMVPHMVIAYCYSSILPTMLKIYYSERVRISKGISMIIEKIWKEEYDERYVNNQDLSSEQKYGKLFMNYFQKYIDVLEEKGVPVKDFCIALFVKPQIELMMEGVDRKKRKFYKRLMEEIEIGFKDKVKLDRKSEVLTECAKILMDNKTVRNMSDNFEKVFNMNRYFGYCFKWGMKYRVALDSPYCDKRHQIYIPKDGEIVFTDYFSRPAGEKEVIDRTTDYLGKNIRNFSVRVRESFLNAVLDNSEFSEKSYEDNSRRRLEKAYARYRKVNQYNKR